MSRKIFSSFVAIACCFFGSSVTFHWLSRPVAARREVCDQLPVVEASCPDGMSEFCDRFALKKPYGEACEPFCQSSVGFFVANAFGNQEFQSGSSCDVRVDADGLEVLRDDLVRGDPVRPARDHVDVERDGVALRVVELVALVREAVVGEQLLRRRRVVGRERLRLCLHRRVGDPLREEAVRGRSRRSAARSRTHRASTRCCGRSPSRAHAGTRRGCTGTACCRRRARPGRRSSRRTRGNAPCPSTCTPCRRSGRSCASSRPGRSGSARALRRSTPPARTRGSRSAACRPASSAGSCSGRSPAT